MILLVLTMLLIFTGYLLPWDQLAIWAITVGSNMAKATPLVGSGGPFSKIMMFPGTDVPMIHAGSDARFFLLAGTFVGENALLRFYVLHCVFIPVIVDGADRDPLLAHPQGWRDQRAAVSGKLNREAHGDLRRLRCDNRS